MRKQKTTLPFHETPEAIELEKRVLREGFERCKDMKNPMSYYGRFPSYKYEIPLGATIISLEEKLILIVGFEINFYFPKITLKNSENQSQVRKRVSELYSIIDDSIRNSSDSDVEIFRDEIDSIPRYITFSGKSPRELVRKAKRSYRTLIDSGDFYDSGELY